MAKPSNQDKQSAEQAPPLPPGERLRLAREAKKLSLAEVSARLKLDEQKIGAMEQGDVASVAEPVFAAGYLRSYARLLELREAEVMDDFADLLPAQGVAADTLLVSPGEHCGEMKGDRTSRFSLRERPAAFSPWRIGLGLVLVLVMVMVMLFGLSDEAQDNRVAQGHPASTELAANERDTTVSADQETPVPQTSAGIPADGAESVESDQLDGGETGLTEKPVPETGQANDVESSAAQASDAPPSTFEALGMGMQSELVLTFNSDSWVEVVDARGERLLYQLGKAGSRRLVMGVAPFSVQLGYVPGVAIGYNGMPYDLSKYAGRRSVRLRIGEAGDRMGGG